MLLVLKLERLMVNYHRFFEKNCLYFLQKIQKKAKKYLTYIFIKTGSNWESFFYQNDQRKKLYKP